MTPYYQRGTCTIYHGAFQEVLAGWPGRSVEAIITDPPYPKAYQGLYRDLGLAAQALLVRGGSLLAIVPHYNLPAVLQMVPLKYRWLWAMVQSQGQHPRLQMGIEVAWKPIVWWVQEAWPHGRGFVRDAFDNAPPDKGPHPWAQAETWAAHCLRVVPAGQLVLEPMMGTGTVLAVAQQLGYPVVGIDLDERCCEQAAQRLEALPWAPQS